MLHLVPPDRKITLALCVAHGLRHDYFRNMLGLDGKSARGDHEGWVLLGNESWLRHSEHTQPLHGLYTRLVT